MRADLIDEGKAFGTNISAVLEQALQENYREAWLARWRAENREAIKAGNAWIEEDGVPFEDLTRG